MFISYDCDMSTNLPLRTIQYVDRILFFPHNPSLYCCWVQIYHSHSSYDSLSPLVRSFNTKGNDVRFILMIELWMLFTFCQENFSSYLFVNFEVGKRSFLLSFFNHFLCWLLLPFTLIDLDQSYLDLIHDHYLVCWLISAQIEHGFGKLLHSSHYWHIFISK